jgi:hypothetical protein
MLERGDRTGDAPAVPIERVPRGTGKRLTVDVDPEVHRRLRVWAAEEGTDGASVVRALLDLFRQDLKLQARVRRLLSG